MKKLISCLSIVILLFNCNTKKITLLNHEGNYKYTDEKQILNVQILNNNNITVEKKVEGNRVKCTGNYKIVSSKRIKFNCVDDRDKNEINSIEHIIPLKFYIKNETIYLETNKIKYKNLLLTKE